MVQQQRLHQIIEDNTKAIRYIGFQSKRTGMQDMPHLGSWVERIDEVA
jgi:hypothetical protein